MLRSMSRQIRDAIKAPHIPKEPLLVVLGATGTGKSQLAVDLATRFNGEIINGDAMQMYDGLPIITNKITVEEQKGIPHHLLGCVALDEEPWQVGMFKRKAGKIVQEIRSRGRLPIVVGGTHYYTQALLFEDSLVHDPVDGEDQLGTQISSEEITKRFPILAGPTEAMIEKLREVDPVMAQRWHPNDKRKIQRSLEIFLVTGKRASEIYAEQKQKKIVKTTCRSEDRSPHGYDSKLDSTLLFWVHSEHEALKARLDARVDKMVQAGLLQEVKSLDQYLQQQTSLGRTVDKTRGIWVSIGWKEFEDYLTQLKSGASTQEELDAQHVASIEQVKAATRQYARRQSRWIRLKLMNALRDEDVLNNLYLLDGSDITKFDGNVSAPAIQIAESFLAGGERCKPSELSSVAKEVFNTQEEPNEAPDEDWTKQECELCHVIAVTKHQWLDHLKSRKHRALVKKRKRNQGSGRPTSQTSDSEAKT